VRVGLETVIFAYIALCVCMLVFNILLILYRLLSEYRFLHDFRHLRGAIQTQLDRSRAGGDIEEKQQIYLRKALLQLTNLRVFYSYLSDGLTLKDPVILAYIRKSKPVFEFLAGRYQRENEIKQAYFAYLIRKYELCSGEKSDLLTTVMIGFTSSPSIYCRQNALQAIYSSGSAEAVVAAIRQMQKNKIVHNTKLMADGFLAFAGDHAQLAGILWQGFNGFRLPVQLAVIQYIRAIHLDYSKELFPLLINQRTDKEIKLAVMRFYGRIYYEPAQDVLLQTLTQFTNDEWEYRAVAASVLANYRSEPVIAALKKSLADENWYVRYNASASLVAMNIGYFDLVDVYNGRDRYAREMLEYKVESSRLISEAREAVSRAGKR